MPDLAKLSAAKLQATYDAQFRKDAEACQRCIDGGMGHWRPSDRDAALRGEISASAAQLALAKEWRANAESMAAINAEMERRKRYSGTLAPIKAAA